MTWGSCLRNHFYLYNPGTDDITWAKSCKTFPVKAKILIITILQDNARGAEVNANKRAKNAERRSTETTTSNLTVVGTYFLPILICFSAFTAA